MRVMQVKKYKLLKLFTVMCIVVSVIYLIGSIYLKDSSYIASGKHETLPRRFQRIVKVSSKGNFLLLV